MKYKKHDTRTDEANMETLCEHFKQHLGLKKRKGTTRLLPDAGSGPSANAPFSSYGSRTILTRRPRREFMGTDKISIKKTAFPGGGKRLKRSKRRS